MKYSLEDLIKQDSERELEYLYWEAVFNSRFDMDSAGDRD